VRATGADDKMLDVSSTTRWVGIAINCADAGPVARFYQHLPGFELGDFSPPHWAQLWDPAGGVHLNIQGEDWYEPPTYPERRGMQAKNYVTRIRSVLADALTHAERRSLVGGNAARLAVMPKCKPTPEPRALTAAEAQAFIAASQPHRLGPMLTTMVSVGLRPGEAAGLRWEDLDLEAGTLAVTGSMKRTDREGGGYELVRGPVKKSTGGQRTLRLPRSLLPVLREQRRRQAAERLAAGPVWEDHGLVFASEAGTPLDPSNVRRAVKSVATGARITWTVQPYTARHTAVSVLIDHGVPLEQVADLVGDDPRTVLLPYRHRVRPVVDAAATGPFDDILEALASLPSEVQPAN
jgi:integrase